MKIRQFLLLSSAMGAATALAGAAVAAEPTAAAGADDSTAGNQVIVTAQKKEEKLQNVPVAVTVINSQTRQDLRITTLQDLTNYTPGLVYSTQLDRAYIRGIGRATNAAGTDPGVAVYNDGFYNASTTGASAPPLFQGDIEVLRGPQGTLYGRNTIGGAINVSSVRPTKTLTADIDASYENYNHSTVSATLSGPLADWLRFRIGASEDLQTQGPFKNISGGPDEGGVRNNQYWEAQLDADLGPHVDAWIKYSGASWDERRRQNVSQTPYCTAPVTFFGGGSPNFGFPTANCQPSGPQPNIPATIGYTVANPGVTNPFAFNTDTPSRDRLTGNHAVVANTVWHADGFDVKYIGGYQQALYTSSGDNDNTARGPWLYQPLPIFGIFPQPSVTLFPQINGYEQGTKYWSHELDFSSTNHDKLQWLGGLYYYNEDSTEGTSSSSPGQTQLLQPRCHLSAPAYATCDAGSLGTQAPNPNSYYNFTTQRVHAVSYAAFGQLDYQITPTLKVTAGARYSVDQKTGTEDERNIAFTPGQYNDGAIAGAYPSTDYTNQFFVGGPNKAINADGTICPASGTQPYKCTPFSDLTGRQLSDSWSGWSGTAGVEWQPDPDTLAYLKYSRGFKSGGFNLGAYSAQEELAPETLNDYDFGLKKTFDRKLTLNLDLYYYDYENSQNTLFAFNPITLVFTTNSINIPRETEYGVELEGVWTPDEHLTFIGSYSYENARITSSLTCAAANPSNPHACIFDIVSNSYKDINGSAPQGAPANKFSLTGSYKFNFEPGSLTFSATYNWRDGNYSSFFNEPAYFNPAYGQVDLRAIWTSASKNYTINAYVTNLSNSKAAEYQIPIPIGGNIAISSVLAAPRVYGVELRYKFR